MAKILPAWEQLAGSCVGCGVECYSDSGYSQLGAIPLVDDISTREVLQGDSRVPEDETAHGESSHHLNILQTTKPSQLTVFGNLYGLVNMTLFLLLVNLLAALVCVELIRGDMNDSIGLNFGQLWNSFLAVYQLFSSENWTNVLYSTAIAEISLGQAVIVIVFLCSWLIFANCKSPKVLMHITLLR